MGMLAVGGPIEGGVLNRENRLHGIAPAPRRILNAALWVFMLAGRAQTLAGERRGERGAG